MTTIPIDLTNKTTQAIVVEILQQFGRGESVHIDCPYSMQANIVSRIRMKISRERKKLKAARTPFRDFKLNVTVESPPDINNRWCRIIMTRTVEPEINKTAVSLLYAVMES